MVRSSYRAGELFVKNVLKSRMSDLKQKVGRPEARQLSRET